MLRGLVVLSLLLCGVVGKADAATYWVYYCNDGRAEVSVSETFTTPEDRSPACTQGQGGWAQIESLADLPLDFALIGITPEKIAYAFGFGFGAMTLLWFFGFVIGAAIGGVKRA